MESNLINFMNSFSNAGTVFLNKFGEFCFKINYKERVWNFAKINYEKQLEYDSIDQAPKEFTKLENNTHETFFRYEGEESIKYKVLEWLSRPALKEGDASTQKWYLDGINKFLGTSFTKKDIEDIYCRLGNNINRSLCVKFVESNFNMEILRE